MNVPVLEIVISKDPFSSVSKSIPAHELPIWLDTWGKPRLKLIGKTEKRHEISSIEEEVERMESVHGVRVLQEVFGASYIDGIEVSITRVIEKEKNIDDSKNTAKSKNRTSTEVRV